MYLKEFWRKFKKFEGNSILIQIKMKIKAFFSALNFKIEASKFTTMIENI